MAIMAFCCCFTMFCPSVCKFLSFVCVVIIWFAFLGFWSYSVDASHHDSGVRTTDSVAPSLFAASVHRNFYFGCSKFLFCPFLPFTIFFYLFNCHNLSKGGPTMAAADGWLTARSRPWGRLTLTAVYVGLPTPPALPLYETPTVFVFPLYSRLKIYF